MNANSRSTPPRKTTGRSAEKPGHSLASRSSRVSAGLLAYRRSGGQLEVFLAHPGGPFFARKDEGHWTIPKGEIESGEEPLAAALREFEEEIGVAIDPQSRFHDLGSIRQKGGKVVQAWAVAVAWNEPSLERARSFFTIEWPPGSGRRQRFPEVDRAQFFPLAEARRKLIASQHPFLDRLEAAVKTEAS